MATYADKDRGDRSQDSQGKEGRDDLGRALGLRLENVVNLAELAVSEGRLRLHNGCSGVEDNIDIKDRARVSGRGSERSNHEVGFEGCLGLEKLNREVLMSLDPVSRDGVR
jgi:hypothetical protein